MGFILRTTFITGFPGETEEQFEELMDFIQDVRFDRLGAFAYSPEDDTPAAEMDDQIDEDIKEARLDRLMTAQQQISLERNESRIGEETMVLVENVRGDGTGTGRSWAEAPETDGVVFVSGVDENDIGRFVKVRITQAQTYDLLGVKE
jgi:ribosomal protein S12 methylthiotransferase